MMQKKVALVTGSASGIGRACATSLARSGYQIAANYRSREAEVMDLITELGQGAHKAFRADIADAAQAETLVAEVVQHYGRVDVLVNAAGQFIRQDISAGDFEQWQQDWAQCMHLNLTAPMNLAFLVSKVMINQQSGKIVNITSRGAFRGEPNAPAYGAAKSGLNSASQSLALALGSQGIHVYAVAPGPKHHRHHHVYAQLAGMGWQRKVRSVVSDSHQKSEIWWPIFVVITRRI
jgi:3-oxoacyl-[acyl-carrier protein] reductase